MTKPKCILCDKEAEFDVPRDLCEDHWQDWLDHKITFYCACACGEPNCPGCVCECGECE